MPTFERKTDKRGRSAVPTILPRTRRWRRLRASRTLSLLMGACRRRSRLSAPADRWRGPGGTGRFHQRKGFSAGSASCSLPDLPANVLALVADALALVRLGRSHRTHLGGGLPHL